MPEGGHAPWYFSYARVTHLDFGDLPVTCNGAVAARRIRSNEGSSVSLSLAASRASTTSFKRRRKRTSFFFVLLHSLLYIILTAFS
jgi:hypothetical protein